MTHVVLLDEVLVRDENEVSDRSGAVRVVDVPAFVADRIAHRHRAESLQRDLLRVMSAHSLTDTEVSVLAGVCVPLVRGLRRENRIPDQRRTFNSLVSFIDRAQRANTRADLGLVPWAAGEARAAS